VSQVVFKTFSCMGTNTRTWVVNNATIVLMFRYARYFKWNSCFVNSSLSCCLIYVNDWIYWQGSRCYSSCTSSGVCEYCVTEHVTDNSDCSEFRYFSCLPQTGLRYVLFNRLDTDQLFYGNWTFIPPLCVYVDNYQVTINSTIFIMTHHAVSHKMIFCCFRRVIWLLTQCFKLISFFYIYYD